MTIREIVEGQAGLPCPNSTKSYWHQDPSKVLFGHRTTPELPETADTVIVGSGITGSFAARFLKHGAAKDEKIVMLEAREACWGATGRNGGHCQPMVYSSAPEISAFELETYHFLKNFVAEHDIPCDWVSFSGCHTFLTQDLFEVAGAAVSQLQKQRPDLAEQIQLVGPDATSPPSDGGGGGNGKETLASLRIPTANGAVVQRHAASLWPYKLVSWVLEHLLADFPAPGFNLQTNTPVTGIRRQGQTATASSSSTATTHPWVLSTPRGRIVARRVLLCTNGYTSRLLPAFADLIVPVRGQVAALLPPGSSDGNGDDNVKSKAAGPAKLQHSYIFMGTYPKEKNEGEKDEDDETTSPIPSTRDDYLVQRPLPRGELILGGGRHLAHNLGVGEWHDDTIEPQVARWLRTKLSPPLDLSADGETTTTTVTELKPAFEWTGVMGYSRDNHAWVGRVPESMGGGDYGGGLWLCAGYTGHGMPVAALSARAAVRMMVAAADDEKDEAEEALRDGLPAGFVLTEERVRRARETMVMVQERESRGWEAILPKLAGLVIGKE